MPAAEVRVFAVRQRDQGARAERMQDVRVRSHAIEIDIGHPFLHTSFWGGERESHRAPDTP